MTSRTDVTIAAVPSFFSSDQLNPLLLSPGGALTFSLVQDFSNSTGLGKTSDVELSAAFDPLEASDFLNFDSTSSVLSSVRHRQSPGVIRRIGSLARKDKPPRGSCATSTGGSSAVRSGP